LNGKSSKCIQTIPKLEIKMMPQTVLEQYLERHEPTQRALFIGNGINRLNGGNMSWKKLLEQLLLYSGTDNKVDLGSSKPFPLLFEEILHQMTGNRFYNNLKNLKTIVKEEIDKNIRPNGFHKQIIDTGYENILTTNYDYTLELSIAPQFKKKKEKGHPNQYLYSDKRVNSINGVNIWHIHGELDNGFLDNGTERYPAQSIMLGYDHYTGYFNKIYQHLVNVKQSKSEELLSRELNSLETLDKRWYYFLFTHNVDIVGIDLTPSELHLWWLLTYRSKLSKRSKIVRNTIRFFIPCYELIPRKEDLSLLASFGIEIMPVYSEYNNGRFYEGFYNEVIKQITK
jgi:hypothetical protein